MADKSSIEWTDATWNIITGCTLVDEGCRHCYAAHLITNWPALGNHPSRKGLARKNAAGEAKFTGDVRFNAQWLDQPMRWRKHRRIFVCAHGDLFHESVPDDWVDQVFAVMALTPQHTFQVLTKRPERARDYLQHMERIYHASPEAYDEAWGQKGCDIAGSGAADFINDRGFPLRNVWIGTSISDQSSADLRIPQLLACPAAMRFISAEPLLGLVDLHRWMGVHHHPDNNLSDPETAAAIATVIKAARDQFRAEHGRHGIDWVICGGESGPKARPMHPDWARSLRDQCQAAGVAFLFKQWGEWVSTYDRDRDDPDWRQVPKPGDWDRKRWLNLAAGQGFHGDRLNMMTRIGKKAAGRLLDGREWNEVPK